MPPLEPTPNNNPNNTPDNNNPAPSNPPTPPEPVIPINQPAPVTPPQPSVPVVPPPSAPENPVETKSKSKKPLIIGAIVAAVLLVAGIATGVTFAIINSNRPENIALDAFSKFLSAPNISASGKFSFRGDNDQGVSANASIDFTSQIHDRLYNLTEATIKYTAETGLYDCAYYSYDDDDEDDFDCVAPEEEQSLSLTLGSAYLEDGSIYIKPDGISQVFSLFAGFLQTTDISDLFSSIDGTWWRISLPGDLDNFDELSASDKSDLTTAYNCLTGELKSLSGNSKNIIDSYRRHPFATISEYTDSSRQTYLPDNNASHSVKYNTEDGTVYTRYDLTIDAQVFVDFYNDAIAATNFNGLATCLSNSTVLSSVVDADSFKLPAITISDLADEDGDLNLPEITVGITDSSHELVYLDLYSYDDESGSTLFNVDLSYPATSTISAPANSRPVTELYSSIVEALSNLY